MSPERRQARIEARVMRLVAKELEDARSRSDLLKSPAPRRPSIDKKLSEQIHFKRRARERLGAVRGFDYKQLCEMARGAPVVREQSLRVSIRELEIGGRKVNVAWDKQRGRLVTVLIKEGEDG